MSNIHCPCLQNQVECLHKENQYENGMRGIFLGECRVRRRHRRRKANPKVEENFFPIPSSHSPFRIPILVGDLEERKSFFLLPFPQAALPIPIRIFGMRMLRGKILQTIGQWFANSFPSPISGDSTYVVIFAWRAPRESFDPVTSAIL